MRLCLAGDAVLPLQLRHPVSALLQIQLAAHSGQNPPLVPPQKPLLPGAEGTSPPSPPPPLTSSLPATAQTPRRYHHASGIFKFNLMQNQKDFSSLQKPCAEPKLLVVNVLPYNKSSLKGRTITPPRQQHRLMFTAQLWQSRALRSNVRKLFLGFFGAKGFLVYFKENVTCCPCAYVLSSPLPTHSASPVLCPQEPGGLSLGACMWI